MTGGALNSGLGMIGTERTRGQSESAGVGVRIAVYPRSGEPEVTEVAAASPGSATAKFTRLVMDEVRAVGGKVPEESVREVVENLVHADYRGVVISVLDGGNLVRVSDKGPGVQHKGRAMEYGFSGATPEAREKPSPERYAVTSRTAAIVRRARDNGDRILAIGTTAVRALESSVDASGEVRTSRGWRTWVIPTSPGNGSGVICSPRARRPRSK